MRGPRADAIQEVTDHYLSTTQFPPGPLNPDQKKKIKSTLMAQVTTYLESLNANLLQASRYKIPQDLTPYQIVQLYIRSAPRQVWVIL